MLTKRCPKCGRIGQIRVERVITASQHRVNYSCTACHSSWSTTSRQMRKRPKRKHFWFA